MQARFRIPASSMLLISLALLGRPEKGYAQVTDYSYMTNNPTAELQQFYVNFALQSSTGMNFATSEGFNPDLGPSGTLGLKRLTLHLAGRPTGPLPGGACIEVTTSVANTGYPWTHVWFDNWNAGWQSISTGPTNFVRAYVDEHDAIDVPLSIFAGSSSTNNKDFIIQTSRVITPNRTSSECQVAGKPFVDFTQEDANGNFFTANTN
jgi:hypothetical protein